MALGDDADEGLGAVHEDVFNRLQEGEAQDLNLVLKGDVVGSVEAAISELGKIQHPEVRVSVIHQGVGGITENDIMLASASNAIVAGFNVRPNAEARALADREGVEIRTYRVIYQLTEDIQQALVGMLAPEQREETIGTADPTTPREARANRTAVAAAREAAAEPARAMVSSV